MTTTADLTERERFYGYVLPDAESGCWLWQGHTARGANGADGVYGKFVTAGGREVMAVRWAYENITPRKRLAGRRLFRLPACPNKLCVNPEHWEPREWGKRGTPSSRSPARRAHATG